MSRPNRPTIEYPNPIPVYPANSDTDVIFPTIVLGDSDPNDTPTDTRTLFPILTISDKQSYSIHAQSPRLPKQNSESRMTEAGRTWRALAVFQMFLVVALFGLLIGLGA